MFKFIDRGFKKSIILIPGWATDSRIFENLDIPFNYLMPESVSPEEAKKVIKHIPGRLWRTGMSILGWSMGGFVASDIVSEGGYAFEKIVLVSICSKYSEDGITYIKTCLRKNAGAYLHSFYKKLFAGDERQNKKWFRENLLKKYTEDTGSLYLLEGLDYLSNTELKVNSLNNPDVTFVHGKNDIIATLHEAESVVSRAPLARAVFMENACHLPFLRKEFTGIFKAVNHA